MTASRWSLGLLMMLVPALAQAQATNDKPADPTEFQGDNVGLVGSVFVTGATVMDLCGNDDLAGGQTAGNQTCEALVMGLYNGFLYGTTYGGFVTCVPEDIGSEQIVPLFTSYVRLTGPAEWDHAGDTMARLFQTLGWGGYEGEACLDGMEQVAQGDIAQDTNNDAGSPLSEQLATANLAEGERVFGMCSACHQAREGGTNQVGPNLWQFVGRPVASVDGYAYSNALIEMRDSGAVWDLDTLSDYLENSLAAVPGTSMMFRGVRDPVDRVNLLAYLASLTSD